MTAQEAQTDTLADVPRCDTGPDGVDHADNLMARHHRLAGFGTLALNAERVAVAHSAAVNPKPDMTGTGRDQLAVH
jgi:hypothetical protein